MKKLIKASAAILASLSIAVPGIVSAHSGSISYTGPNSTNRATFNDSNDTDVENNNNVSLTSSKTQRATSGNVEAEHNTTAGNATSGAASNDASLHASVTVDNSSASGMSAGTMGSGDNTATIDHTGPNSTNKVTVTTNNDLTITNNNNVSVRSTVNQTAKSGNVEVSGNTTGGNATSGDASNTSSSEFTLSITN